MNNKYVKRWRTENNCLPLVFNDIFTPRGNLNLLCHLRSVIFNSLILRSMKWVIHKLLSKNKMCYLKMVTPFGYKSVRNLYDLFTRWELRNLLFFSGMHKSKKVWTCGDISKRLRYFSKHTIFQQVAPKMLHQGLFFLLFLDIYKQFWSKQKKSVKTKVITHSLRMWC